MAWFPRAEVAMTEKVWIEVFTPAQFQNMTSDTIAKYTIHLFVADPPQGGGHPTRLGSKVTDNLANKQFDTNTMKNDDFDLQNFGSFVTFTTWFGLELKYTGKWLNNYKKTLI